MTPQGTNKSFEEGIEMEAKRLLCLSITVFLAVMGLRSLGYAQENSSVRAERLQGLESRLESALRLLTEAQSQIAELARELRELRQQPKQAKKQRALPPREVQRQVPAVSRPAFSPLVEKFLGWRHGGDERGNDLQLRPEVFIQSRFSALPVNGGGISDFDPNFSLTRVETRWSGRVSDRIGAGLELQYHPALDGAAEELVNDAFMEYYLNAHQSLRVGQFVRPFGFDIQQSSSERESPERAIFAGYFFPGQRDRGMMLSGDLDWLEVSPLKNVHYWIGVFNGNRFFNDNNTQANALFRVRKLFPEAQLALGFSTQVGKQQLPAGIMGNNDERLFGMDLQWAFGPLGIRGEFVAGNMPSTLLGLEPEFAPAFRPGRHSTGGAVFVRYRINKADNLYARFDQFNGDPVTGGNVRAFNVGYLRQLNEHARVAVDYQFKSRLTFNDDKVNTRLAVTWGMLF